MIGRMMPDFEQTLKFFEDIKPHLEKHLDDEQHFEFVGLCITDFFRNKHFHIDSLMRYLAALETHAIVATFQPSYDDEDEKIVMIAHRIMDICRKFLTHKQAERALLRSFLTVAGDDHELCPIIDDFLDKDVEFNP